MVHRLSRAVIDIRNEDEQGHGRQESKVANNRSKRLTRQDMKARIALHYLNKDTGDQDYGTLINERTKFAEEKLFSDL